VWQDRVFLAKYIPRILDYLHYRVIDVSSIKELVRHWYPNHPYAIFDKPEYHRTLADILASIDELRYYRKHFFIEL
jgi:oligoribonuclease